jgi:2-polyprenyl-6-methoxyphenol hydroxylase-like FAD-dependent oxidoreductase
MLDSLNLRQLALRGALAPRHCQVLWSRPHPDLLTADQMQGWLLVNRGQFDALLLRAAASAGVSVMHPGTVRAARHETCGWQVTAVVGDTSLPIEAAYLVDATGRAGFLRGRRELVSPRTIAVCGYLRRPFDGHDILVEALADGWCWGAPLPDEQFVAIIFLDTERIRAIGRERLTEFWRSRLAGTELFAAVSQWPLVEPLLTRDATSYFAVDPINTAFARIGDACYALDPLSSTGVEKAVRSATVAATAIHTILEQPSRVNLCLRFYRDRQQEAISAHGAWTSEFYGGVARYAEMPFWRARSKLHDLAGSTPTTSTMPAASPVLAAATFALKTIVGLSAKARIEEEPCVVDDQICLRAAVKHPSLNRPIVFLHDVELWPLLRLVETSMDVNGLIDLWSARVPREKAYQMIRWLMDRQILEAL